MYYIVLTAFAMLIELGDKLGTFDSIIYRIN